MLKRLISFVFLLIVCSLVLAPYLMMIVCTFSIKGNTVFENLSSENFIKNIMSAYHQKGFINSILNSVIISTTSSLLGIFIASFAGFGYEFHRSKLSELFFTDTVLSMNIPASS